MKAETFRRVVEDLLNQIDNFSGEMYNYEEFVDLLCEAVHQDDWQGFDTFLNGWFARDKSSYTRMRKRMGHALHV